MRSHCVRVDFANLNLGILFYQIKSVFPSCELVVYSLFLLLLGIGIWL